MSAASQPRTEAQQMWAARAVSATRIANQRLLRADNRRAFNAQQDKKYRQLSGLKDKPDGSWGNRAYGDWYPDSVAASWDAQHAALTSAKHFNGATKRDNQPWDFNAPLSKSSQEFGRQTSLARRNSGSWDAVEAPAAALRLAKRAEAHRPRPKVARDAWSPSEKRKVEMFRSASQEEIATAAKQEDRKAAVYNMQQKDSSPSRRCLNKDQNDHFVGSTMMVSPGAEQKKSAAHGCKHFGGASISAFYDHFQGMRMGEDATLPVPQGKMHVKSIEPDHFVGPSFTLGGRGEAPKTGVAMVPSEGTIAQSVHFTNEYVTLKPNAGSDNLFSTMNPTELTHLGAARRRSAAQEEHFEPGSMTLEGTAHSAELFSVDGSTCLPKGRAAHAAGEGDHFTQGRMVLDSNRVHEEYQPCGLPVSRDQHGRDQHGFMNLEDRSSTRDLVSVDGMQAQHRAQVEGRSNAKDHFVGYAMRQNTGSDQAGSPRQNNSHLRDHFEGNVLRQQTFEAADDGLMSSYGVVLSSHPAAPGEPHASDDHFYPGAQAACR